MSGEQGRREQLRRMAISIIGILDEGRARLRAAGSPATNVAGRLQALGGGHTVTVTSWGRTGRWTVWAGPVEASGPSLDAALTAAEREMEDER